MLTAQDIGGLMAMMPAFATDDAADMRARNTVDVERLRSGLDRMVRDGADVISTTGSFGECHTLLPHEFTTLARESADVVDRRVPLFIGVTAPNAREVVERMKIVSETRADGVLAGVPYYFPSSLPNAIRFYREIAELFPKLNIMIYHNPALHNVTLTLEVMQELAKIPSVIGMKDSHRDTLTFMRLQKIVAGRISVFCNQLQYVPYAELGARGLWSIDAWMGPWPLFALRDAVARKDWAAAKDIILDIGPKGTRKTDLSWRETASKIAVRCAGYVDPGPLRPPFLEIPEAVLEAQRKKAEEWKKLCAKYAPAYGG
jgi:dihydrodipicolinate synthase/N-acetylneuraminate lyase